MQLYDNPETKIVYASDDAQDQAMQLITADEIAGLVAQGYTVDSSAQPFVPEAAPVSGETGTPATLGATGSSATDVGASSTSSTGATDSALFAPVTTPAVPTTSSTGEGDAPLTPAPSVSPSAPAGTATLADGTDAATGVPLVVTPVNAVGTVDVNGQAAPEAGIPPAAPATLPVVTADQTSTAVAPVISSTSLGTSSTAVVGVDQAAAAQPPLTPSEVHLYFERIKKEIQGFGIALEAQEHAFFDNLKAKILGD